MAWKIVLRPNFDAPTSERGDGLRVVERDYETREGAIAVEQGIAAGGRWWGKVMRAEDVPAYLKEHAA